MGILSLQRMLFPRVYMSKKQSHTEEGSTLQSSWTPLRAPMGALPCPDAAPGAVRGITEDRLEEKPAPAMTQIPLQPDPSLKS